MQLPKTTNFNTTAIVGTRFLLFVKTPNKGGVPLLGMPLFGIYNYEEISRDFKSLSRAD
jgi:hypothetical protein